MLGEHHMVMRILKSVQNTMKKLQIRRFFGVKSAVAALFLVASFAVLGSLGAVFAQTPPATEICNGKDDNGDGVADENVNCDHYLSYLVDKSVSPVSVVLRDQFINPTDFTLALIERLLNPVKKLHAGITFSPRRPDLHYVAYRLKSPALFAPRSVLIENQFEKRNITVTKPRYVLTPTGKKKIGIPIERVLSVLPPAVAEKFISTIVPPIPKDANHYLCYDVEPYEIAKGVQLKDQFQSKSFEVVRARYLCNPAEKIHSGKTYPIVDNENHLMCYEIIPHNLVNRQVLTHNQFGIKSLKAVQTEELCVPTVKTHPPECSLPDDHGTAALFDANTHYQNTDGQLVVVQPTPVGAGLTADALMHGGPDTVVTRSGTPETGETYTLDTELLQLDIMGLGMVELPVSGSFKTSPRTPGNPMQSFDTEMIQLQGQLPPGDPDFDLLRITAGTDLGLPSPGHTTLTQMPGGNWQIDSFFDITYRIDFVGAPGGSMAGQSGSSVGTVRMQHMCPLPE